MKSSVRYFVLSALALALALTPDYVSAQNRHNRESSSSASRSSSQSSGNSRQSGPSRSSRSSSSRSQNGPSRSSRNESSRSHQSSQSHSSQSRQSQQSSRSNSYSRNSNRGSNNSNSSFSSSNDRSSNSYSRTKRSDRAYSTPDNNRTYQVQERKRDISRQSAPNRNNSKYHRGHENGNRRPQVKPMPGRPGHDMGRPGHHGRPGHPGHIPGPSYVHRPNPHGFGPHNFGYRVKVIPAGFHSYTHWGRTYYYCNGVYYRPWHNHYIVCRPPFGVILDAIDDLAYIGVKCAYYNNIYRTYNIINDNYREIDAQNRIIAQNNATIAAQNANIALNNELAEKSYSLASRLGLIQSFADASQQYFYDDGVFYIKNADGKYKVIVPPAGAIITELPKDFEQIELQGETYYKVDNTIYRLTIVDGTACMEVLGQLPQTV